MKNTVSAVIAFVLMAMVAPAPGGWQAASASGPEDEEAIRQIVARLQDGWNAGDGRAFAAPFAADADYVIVNGGRVKGREAIRAGHQGIFDTIYKNSVNAAEVQSIRLLRPDVAVVHVQWRVKTNQNGGTREARAMCSMVMTKDNGQWSIAAFHNTPIAEAGK